MTNRSDLRDFPPPSGREGGCFCGACSSPTLCFTESGPGAPPARLPYPLKGAHRRGSRTGRLSPVAFLPSAVPASCVGCQVTLASGKRSSLCQRQGHAPVSGEVQEAPPPSASPAAPPAAGHLHGRLRGGAVETGDSHLRGRCPGKPVGQRPRFWPVPGKEQGRESAGHRRLLGACPETGKCCEFYINLL